MASKKIITVFGATGKQGGSVAAALFNDPAFKVRAVTRNPDSPRAKALADKGAELVKGDLSDPASLPATVEGAYGCFLLTDYWSHCDEAKEISQGKIAVDACKAAGVQHLVYSSLESVVATVKKACPHFDGKAVIGDYIKEQGVPYTLIQLSFYMENWLKEMAPQRQEGTDTFKLGMDLGDATLPVNSGGEPGEIVRAVFDQPERFKNQIVGIVSDDLPMKEYCAIMSEVTGRNIVENKGFTPAVLEGLEGTVPFAAEFASMFEHIAAGHQKRDLKLTFELDPKFMKFREWCEKNKDTLLKAMPL